mgnify:CR=1 FL=1
MSKAKRRRQFTKSIGELLTDARAAGRPTHGGAMTADVATQPGGHGYKPTKRGRFWRIEQTYHATGLAPSYD